MALTTHTALTESRIIGDDQASLKRSLNKTKKNGLARVETGRD